MGNILLERLLLVTFIVIQMYIFGQVQIHVLSWRQRSGSSSSTNLPCGDLSGISGNIDIKALINRRRWVSRLTAVSASLAWTEMTRCPEGTSWRMVATYDVLKKMGSLVLRTTVTCTVARLLAALEVGWPLSFALITTCEGHRRSTGQQQTLQTKTTISSIRIFFSSKYFVTCGFQPTDQTEWDDIIIYLQDDHEAVFTTSLCNLNDKCILLFWSVIKS